MPSGQSAKNVAWPKCIFCIRPRGKYLHSGSEARMQNLHSGAAQTLYNLNQHRQCVHAQLDPRCHPDAPEQAAVFLAGAQIIIQSHG